MDVSYKGQKVVVFIAEDGFVAILKKMAAPIVAVIEYCAYQVSNLRMTVEMSWLPLLKKI